MWQQSSQRVRTCRTCAELTLGDSELNIKVVFIKDDKAEEEELWKQRQVRKLRKIRELKAKNGWKEREFSSRRLDQVS